MIAALLLTPLPLAALAQDEMPAPADMTCADFNGLDDEGRYEAMEALAGEAGMDEEAAEESVQSARMAVMTEACEADPDLAATDAFQNAMDDPD